MTVAVDAAPAAVPPDALSPPPSPARLRFVGARGDYWRLMIRGGALQAVTLGIYRFWLLTDMRRFAWASTEVEGETLEYIGTAVELLIGFLAAIGILVPVCALLFVAPLQFGVLSRLSSIAAFVVLAALGQYAAVRARRYRLTRTVFCGLRFHPGGSGERYTLRAMLWLIPIGVTLGLASPRATANLERYKMRNTFYGSLGGSFAGSGLFWRCLSMWALVIGPLVVALAVAATFTDWPAMTGALGRGSLEGMVAAPTDTGQVNLWLWLLGTWVAYTVILGVAVYPAYRAIVMRWWHGGLWLGGAVAASERRIRLCYSAYLRYLLYVVLFSIALAAVVGVGVALIRAGMRGQINFSSSRRLRAALLVVSVIVGYVIYLLGVSAIDQLVVKMRLWQAPVESVAISDIAALHHVQASKATSSALGEGLADALGIGAI